MKKIITALGIVFLFLGLNAATKDPFYKYTNYNPDAPESNILESDFKDPQGLAKVSAWWHWLNGNVTKEGIDKDLKEMADKGFGSVRIFQIDASIQGPIEFNSPEYYEMFDYSTKLAKDLGLKIGIHNCEGWSMAGGPWITPEMSMKRLTWTSAYTKGDGKEQTFTLKEPLMQRNYYEDIAVVAWKNTKPSKLKFQEMLEEIYPATEESGLEQPPNYLFDGINGQYRAIFAKQRSHDFVSYGIAMKLKEPVEIRAAYLLYAFQHDITKGLILEASDDGVNYKKVADIEMSGQENYFEFEPVKAKYWRLIRYKQPPTRRVLLGHESNFIMNFKEIELIAVGEKSKLRSSIPEVAKKTAQITDNKPPLKFDRDFPASDSVSEKDIYVFRNGINPDGTFTWTPPNDGAEYTIARIGCTTTGKEVHPTTKGGKGLETDKFSAEATELHFNSYAKKMIDAVGNLSPDTFFLVETDSWEAGCQNWTKDFDKIFKDKTGYEFFKYFPVFAGESIVSGDNTEKFLADFREVASSLVINNFYGKMRECINAQGMLYEAEPHPANEVTFFNEMDTFMQADIPMDEIWQQPREPGVVRASSGYGSHKACTSAAHFYGKKYISCESATSMSGNWAQTPWNIKGTTDTVLMGGFNSIVYHSYTHQPDERAPGWQMEPWGIALNRKMPWWNYSKDFFSYINRTQYMLQQGKFATDILHFFADEIPQSKPKEIALPHEYHYDIINSTGVRDFMRVEDGFIVSPGNMKYKVMFVSPHITFKLESLRKLKELVEAGATISVTKNNQFYFSKIGGEKAEQEWNNLFAEIFKDGSKQIFSLGKGKIFVGHEPMEVLKALDILPRIKFEIADAPSNSIMWQMREFQDSAKWFYLINAKNENLEANVSFRVSGKDVFFWYPESGKTIQAPIYTDDGTYTKVMMSFKELESVFVVFKDKTNPNRVVQVKWDGAERFPNINLTDSVDNTMIYQDFTVAFQVTPKKERDITEASLSGLNMPKNENLIAKPEPMHETMKNNSHSTASISVGTNSIAVFEHGAHMYTPVLVFDGAIPENSKIALIYKDNKASLWLNGKIVAQNDASTGKIVHPIRGIENAFKGDIKRFAILDSALDAGQIEAFIKSQPENKIVPKRPLISFDKNGNAQAEFFADGKVDVKFADGKAKTFEERSSIESLYVKGPFNVAFDSKWGAPAKVVFDELASWTEHKDAGIKHYSGVATYTTKVKIPAEKIKSAQRVYLQVDKVYEVAQIKINGKVVGIMWRPPYSIDVTNFVKAGENTIEIGVANTWVNRCVYDATLPKEQRLTWANSMATHYPAAEHKRNEGYLWKHGILPSGLVGDMKFIFTK